MKKHLKTVEPRYTPAPIELLPPGPERDFRRILWLNTCWNSQATTVERWNKALKLIEEEKTYERYPPENPAGTIEELVKTLYGISIKETKDIVIGKHGGDRKSKDRNQPDSDKVERAQYGTSTEYYRARLRRDFPEILAQLDAGEFESTKAAAIAAGIVKGEYKISISGEDPNKAAATILRAIERGKIDSVYIESLIAILQHKISEKEGEM